MQIEIAELIGDITGADVRDDYSGRGMYGEETAAVVGMPAAIAAALVANAEELAERVAELKADGVEMPSGFRTDNMGLDMVMY
jgi:hypothetical protein